jgi:hypothetical protein
VGFSNTSLPCQPKPARKKTAGKAANIPGEGSFDPTEDQEKPKRLQSDDAFDSLLKPFYYGKKLTDPIDTARDKWNLLPAFLRVKGLIKQHIDSFNYFIDTELANIVEANKIITSDVDQGFYVQYATRALCVLLSGTGTRVSGCSGPRERRMGRTWVPQSPRTSVGSGT